MLRLAMWCALERQVNKSFSSRPADVGKPLSLEMSESSLSISLDAQAGLTGIVDTAGRGSAVWLTNAV